MDLCTLGTTPDSMRTIEDVEKYRKLPDKVKELAFSRLDQAQICLLSKRILEQHESHLARTTYRSSLPGRRKFDSASCLRTASNGRLRDSFNDDRATSPCQSSEETIVRDVGMSRLDDADATLGEDSHTAATPDRCSADDLEHIYTIYEAMWGKSPPKELDATLRRASLPLKTHEATLVSQSHTVPAQSDKVEIKTEKKLSRARSLLLAVLGMTDDSERVSQALSLRSSASCSSMTLDAESESQSVTGSIPARPRYYQDPDARKQIRDHLSPAKFDEAIHMGYTLLEQRRLSEEQIPCFGAPVSTLSLEDTADLSFDATVRVSQSSPEPMSHSICTGRDSCPTSPSESCHLSVGESDNADSQMEAIPGEVTREASFEETSQQSEWYNCEPLSASPVKRSVCYDSMKRPSDPADESVHLCHPCPSPKMSGVEVRAVTGSSTGSSIPGRTPMSPAAMSDDVFGPPETRMPSVAPAFSIADRTSAVRPRTASNTSMDTLLALKNAHRVMTLYRTLTPPMLRDNPEETPVSHLAPQNVSGSGKRPVLISTRKDILDNSCC